MSRSTVHRLLATFLAASVFLLGQPDPAVHARGQDVCPEPNDTFQTACYLGPASDAIGFISRPDDIDAYRIEVLDFNVDVHAEISEMPFPYRLNLANWNGDLIATSSNQGGVEAIDTTVSVPGSYYIFVDSRTGQFSDSQPYRVFRQLTYPGSSIPQILYSGEFREGGGEGFTGSNDFADYSESGGKYTIAMKRSGTQDEGTHAWSYWGPEFTDFTMTVDTRVVSGSPDPAYSGYTVFFRSHLGADYASSTGYRVEVNSSGDVRLRKIDRGEVVNVTDWRSTSAASAVGGVNRTVIRCAGSDILINLNGYDVLHLNDRSFASGRFGFGAATWGEPVVVSFDNVIVTTPSEG